MVTLKIKVKHAVSKTKEVVVISIQPLAITMTIKILKNLTLYLICQFWALPIQQQINI